MRVTKTMRPRQRGTGRFMRRYGDRLVCVRYRKSNCARRMVTTVEVIVDERESTPKGISHTALQAATRSEPVAVKIDYAETALRSLVKESGARWSRVGRAWVLPRGVAVGLGLTHRINETLIQACTDVDTSIEIG